MDLIIETKQYKLKYDHFEMVYIHTFISRKLNRYARVGVNYYLTKKEVKELIKWLNSQSWSNYNKQKEKLIDQLILMEMVMEGKERARFYFW